MGEWHKISATSVHESLWSSGYSLSVMVACECGRVLQLERYEHLTLDELKDVEDAVDVPRPGCAVWHDRDGDAFVQPDLWAD